MKRALLFFLSAAALLAQQHSVTLTWTNATSNPSGTTVTLYRQTGACPATPPTSMTGFTQVAAGVTGTTYIDTAVTAGIAYCYIGVSSAVISGVSTDAGATVPSNFPPQMLSATAN